MAERTSDEVRGLVRDVYGQVARDGGGCGCGPGPCGPSLPAGRSEKLGYSPEEIAAAPEGADLGLGCGNPQAIAALRPGEAVLDLGSGGGFDCFLAARQVGPSGRVIGVDMTPEMLARARANARKIQAWNVEFRLGEIERLPVADASVDVIVSNCVVNLSPDKGEVFREAYRVLRPGGRLAIADVVAKGPLPAALAESAAALTGCVAGAATIEALEAMLAEAGFRAVRVRPRPGSDEIVGAWMPELDRWIVSATIEAVKPA